MTPFYSIKDVHEEGIAGFYYKSELQRTPIKDNALWKIAKELKTKERGPYQQYYII